MRKIITLMMLGILFVLCLCAQAKGAPVHLALIVEGNEAASAGDMLTVQLSRQAGLELLERSKVNQIYHEQKLSARNSGNYLKLGQILGADGLLIMELVRGDSSQFLNVRLVAVKTGLLLKSERFPWPIEKGEQWAERVVEHIQPLISKLSITVADAVPISIVNISSPVQTPESRELLQQLAFLAPERLGVEPQLFVLERRRMQWLSEEKQFQGLEDTNFWSGSYLLSLVIDRDGYSPTNITLNVTLTPPQGGTPLPIDVHGDRTNLTDVVNHLAEAITGKLKLNSTNTSWLVLEEAKRFSEEADWDLRWGMLEEAQSASESAWALGLRNQQLAATRIRAYAQSLALPNPGNDNSIKILAVPDPSQIPAAARVLELFSQDAPAVFSTPGATNLEWYALGIQTLRNVAGLLEGYYLVAEARQGHEEVLSNLRTLARQTAEILHTNIVNPTNFFFNKPPFYGGARKLEWEEGGMWFDKPEDSVARCRQLLEEGYNPERLPRLVGWSWNDRKRVPALLARLLQESLNSTNPPVRLESQFLSLSLAPAAPSDVLDAKQNELIASMWDLREQLWATPESASLLWRTEDVLQKKYEDGLYERFFSKEPFAHFRHEFRRNYLLSMVFNPNGFREEVFQTLFPPIQGYRQDPSKEQAAELYPLIEEIKKKSAARLTNMLNAEIRVLRRIATNSDLTPVRAEPKLPDPRLLTGPSLTAEFIGWKLHKPGVEPGYVPESTECKVRAGRLWCRMRYHTPGNSFDWGQTDQRNVYASIDPATGEVYEIPFPPQLGFPDPHFEVTSNSLCICVQDHLCCYHFNERIWENIALPMTAANEILGIGRRLYLGTGDSILELDIDSKQVQILASSRRHPALSELDSILNGGWSLYSRSDGNLGLVVTNGVFSFSATNRTWTPANRGFNTRFWGRRFGLDGDFQYMVFGMWERMFEFGTGATNVTVLLAPTPKHPGYLPPSIQQLPEPVWEWPDVFPFEKCLVAGSGKRLSLLVPRRVRRFDGNTEEPVKFDDSRDATLLRFEPGLHQPLALPIHFQNANGFSDPLDFGREFQFLFGNEQFPYWLSTESGELIVRPEQAGHWLVPRAQEEARLESLRNQSRKAGAQNQKRTGIPLEQVKGKP